MFCIAVDYTKQNTNLFLKMQEGGTKTDTGYWILDTGCWIVIKKLKAFQNFGV